MLFVRDVTGALGMLLKQLDEAVAANKAVDLRSFAVVLTDDREATEAKLKELAQKYAISDNVPLVIPEDLAPLKRYKIHQDAEVTVLLYRRCIVLDNFAFKAGELKEQDVKAIMAALPKIIPSQEDLEREAKEKAEAELKRKLEAEKQKAAKKENE
ncbi:MAG: hypothetical protein H8E44_26950 [Planctomycetes bacterium]|nr:hypothetical protein [Planctomycetota bacterium]MBL7043295.1 hypothetical protein [Pirellulaceae bacterium]